MVDKKDFEILSHIRKNSNQPITDIAKSTGIPLTTIYDRMRSHEKKLIKRYTVLLDFTKLGYHTKMKIALGVKKEQKERLLKFLLGHPSTNSISKIDLGYDLFAEMIFKSHDEAHTFIDELDEKFKIEKKHIFFVVDEIERERFLTGEGCKNEKKP